MGSGGGSFAVATGEASRPRCTCRAHCHCGPRREYDAQEGSISPEVLSLRVTLCQGASGGRSSRDSRMYRKSGSPRDTPTARFAAIGAQRRFMLALLPSTNTSTQRTSEDTVTSMPKKPPTGFENIYRKKSG